MQQNTKRSLNNTVMDEKCQTYPNDCMEAKFFIPIKGCWWCLMALGAMVLAALGVDFVYITLLKASEST
jgi:hypothetical protein